ncbi:phospholipid/cholesterol/gamma-HCH transport system substrate-binding protein [Haloechinothrix alba]|uniref:Phospholipid/cholesterol/gamma-HCH transport system substrate-binding protein n=1 Tax=Haloechinothrix alba TaxID=664784 RepID=A0A238YHB2_9PSEU|nr:MCE family protein [Haloechinothrix alba]SNR70585.1 phospholipid/cholesterol/gamma-HCH transport system substrate-binding protein [Haloechinothrix alba]
MKSFQQFNPIPIALVGIVALVLGVVAAMNSEKLPVIGAGTLHSAEFEEAAGLQSGNEVRVAGIKVGEVDEVNLDGDRVVVDFRVKDTWLGDDTRAGIELKDMLGQKYMSLDPAGEEVLDPSEPIPLERTSSPFDVLEAFRELSETTDAIDTERLAESFDVMSETFSDTPEHVEGALTGLSKLSDTISERDSELKELLTNTEQISQTLSERDEELVKLMRDGNRLLDELRQRKEAISALLRGTQELAEQLRGLVEDNQEQLNPVLQELDQFTSMLHRNREALSQGLQEFAPFIRKFANVVGSGRWFDNYICGLLPPSEGPYNEEGCDPR